MTPSSPSQETALLYTPGPYGLKRRKTRVVRVGALSIGGDNPIRLQSMTTTDTCDVPATAAQALRMVEAGCELVRVTAPTVEDARALGRIKAALLARGCAVPLAADIHFSPQAALEAAEHAEKVRINPGNFVDSKRFALKEYTEAEYAAELERIEERFTPLVEKLKRLGRALRLGVNHGSLSDRIMNRYGDTPLGMVESALEFVRICEKNGYGDIILSMKASNPKVMLAAYRLLAARMDALGMDYPFHLGVTEAGGGADGRIKSAIGIGSLLEDGIGDTIRVSLTEDPEAEIPVCRALARTFQPGADAPTQSPMGRGTGPSAAPPLPFDPFSFTRRESDSVRVGPLRIGGRHPIRTVSPLPAGGAQALRSLLARRSPSGRGPEFIEARLRAAPDAEAFRALRKALASGSSALAFLARFASPALALSHCDCADIAALDAPFSPEEWTAFLGAAKSRGVPVLVSGKDAQEAAGLEASCRALEVPVLVELSGAEEGRSLLKEYRLLAAKLSLGGSKAPMHLRAPRAGGALDQTLSSSVLLGGMLCDGLGDCAQADSALDADEGLDLVYDILQGAGARVTKTEFVSCPSCGRTLFDLQSTTARIQSKTGHLKGVKIAIMGCIVNGPGEMADADFGYVGGAPGRINLYVGKEVVRKGIPTEEADEALVDLIRSNGRWVDPPQGAAI